MRCNSVLHIWQRRCTTPDLFMQFPTSNGEQHPKPQNLSKGKKKPVERPRNSPTIEIAQKKECAWNSNCKQCLWKNGSVHNKSAKKYIIYLPQQPAVIQTYSTHPSAPTITYIIGGSDPGIGVGAGTTAAGFGGNDPGTPGSGGRTSGGSGTV